MRNDGCDVAILGGGVIGASTAFWLTRMDPGLRVVVIERDPSYRHASTALSAASIRLQFSAPINVKISLFGLEFIRDFSRFCPQGGVGDLGFRENGYLFLSKTTTGAEVLEGLAEMQRGCGATTRVLSPAEIARRFPWMNVSDLVAGSFGARHEGWFDNMGLLGGLKAQARAQGADFRHDRVTGLAGESGQVRRVELASGAVLEAGAVVNAMGPRAAEALRWLGEDLPVEPRKRTIFVVDAPQARHPDAPLIIDPQGYWMRPEQGQWLAATVPAEDGPCAADDFEPDAGLFDEAIWPMLYHRAEGFAAAKVQRLWAGHYAFNRIDQNALLGRHPRWRNLYLANGFSGHGLQQAPAVGRGLAELILTGDWVSLDLSPLAFDRLATGKIFVEDAIV